MTTTLKMENAYTNEAGFEGSYAATVIHYGKEWQVQFIASEIRLYSGSARDCGYKGPAWKAKANAAAVRTFIAARIAALGPEFMAAHRKLYTEESN